MRLVLASASPRRLELLTRIGLTPIVHSADVDETPLPGESPDDYVLRVATDKAHVVQAIRRPSPENSPPDAIEPNAAPEASEAEVILAADTTVVLDGASLGKPVDQAGAAAMLASLSGRDHEVLTAVVVVEVDGTEHSILDKAVVTFAEISPAEVAWYVATSEPLDKAGSYAIQGLGAVFVERLVGDPTTVIGLPLRETVELLRTAGLRWPT